MFQNITESTILSAALKTKGSSGPSGIDADGWRRILVSKNFTAAACEVRWQRSHKRPVHQRLKPQRKMWLFADDLSGAGNLASLRRRWNNLAEVGPKLGHYPKASKS